MIACSGVYLNEMGCDNSQKVLRRRGWTFPPLPKCRADWEKRYPGWKWRSPEITEWQPEESGEAVKSGEVEEERRGGSWRRQEETPVLNRRSKRCSACSAFQGVETQNPLRRKHFFHLFRLFPLLEKSK